MSEATNSETQLTEVKIVRGVRFGRIMLTGAVIGGVLAVLMTLTYQVQQDGFYTMAQIAGFMLVIGATLGLLGGGLFALLLNFLVRGKSGTGTAKHTDVQ